MPPKHYKISWRCINCWRLVREHVPECPQCKGHWTQVQDTSYVHKIPQPASEEQQTSSNSWQWSSWPKDLPRDPSVQARGRSASRRARGSKNKPKAEKSEQPMYPSPFQGATASSTPWTGTPFPPSASTYATPAPAPAPKPTPSPATAKEATDIPSAEMVEALRSSYPDLSEAPPKIQALVEKYEKAIGQRWVTDLCDEEARLRQAQAALEDIQEARNKHRDEWMTHLQESVVQWKGMIQSYTQQRSHYDQLYQDATKKVRDANLTIAQLTQKGAQQVTSNVNEETAESLEQKEKDKDAKEGQLRERINKMLQQCVDLTNESDTDVIEVDQEESKDQPPAKRARSVDASSDALGGGS